MRTVLVVLVTLGSLAVAKLYRSVTPTVHLHDFGGREIEQYSWIVLVSVGLIFAILVTVTAYSNLRFQAVIDSHSLRYKLSRAHLRRAVIKLICQLLFVASGFYSLITPPPIRNAVALEQLILGGAFLGVALLLDVDLYLDYRLQRSFSESLS